MQDWADLLSFQPFDRARMIEKYGVGFYSMAKRQLMFFNERMGIWDLDNRLEGKTAVSMVNQECRRICHYVPG